MRPTTKRRVAALENAAVIVTGPEPLPIMTAFWRPDSCGDPVRAWEAKLAVERHCWPGSDTRTTERGLARARARARARIEKGENRAVVR